MAGAVLSRIRRAPFFVSCYEGGTQAKTLRIPMFSWFRTEKRGFSENANVCVFFGVVSVVRATSWLRLLGSGFKATRLLGLLLQVLGLRV